MDSLTIVVTSDNEPEIIPMLLDMLASQTMRPDDVWVMYSGMTIEEEPGVAWIRTPSFHDWGHTKRAMAIGAVQTDWITFWEAHDKYPSRFVECIKGAMEPGVDVIYWYWTGKSFGLMGDAFQGCNTDAGSFAIRTSLARRVGWLNRDYEADAKFISAVAALKPNTVCISEVLMEKT